MKDKRIFLPLYIKSLIIISDPFVLLGLLISIPPIIFGLEVFDLENMNITLTWTIIQASILTALGLIRSIRRISIIESATTFANGIAVGEVVLLDSNKINHHKTMFRLSIEFQIENNKSSIIKNYYLINSNISKSKYDYKFVFDENNPKKAVLINLLPKLARNYIRKLEDTIANKLQ